MAPKPDRTRPEPEHVSREEARLYLVSHLGLARMEHPPGAEGVCAMLEARRAIQLDPLDPLGNNADLVALARVDGIGRGDVFRHVYPGHAFEHFAKERCLLPASAFPWYRDQAVQTPWWRLSERMTRLAKRIDGRAAEHVLETVLDEVREIGPATADELTDHGRVEPLDWSGWKGTARATTMALEVLWTQCRVVVCGRRGTTRVYDVPERALPTVARRRGGAFAPWAIRERVEAAGFLSRAGGAQWSMLTEARASGVPDEMVRRGDLVEIAVEGATRTYFAPPDWRARPVHAPDDRMRILGPLDPLLWDRALVRNAFGFEYVWEVYKPEDQRIWGWYVCPLLHRGELVGRLEGRAEGGVLRIAKLWRERGRRFDEDALDEALARHAAACGASKVRRPRRRTT